MSDMKAVCWEMATRGTGIMGMRVLLAGEHVGWQELSGDNARPRWKFESYGSAAVAANAALELTGNFEKMHGGKLAIEPGEIIIHPSELVAMTRQKPISPALRARIYTSLQRRDPRLAEVSAGASV